MLKKMKIFNIQIKSKFQKQQKISEMYSEITKKQNDAVNVSNKDTK